MGDPDVWPVLLDMSRDDCKRILRRLELEAYSNFVSVLRAQGSLTASKRRLLQSVAQTLGISEERHKAECRRAVNSEKLATIAKHMGGANSGTEWAIEGRRLVPLLPRLVPQTAFTAIADKVANMAMTEGAKLPLPVPPAKKRLSSPPIDETLLEPNIPEASKTPQVSSAGVSDVPAPADPLVPSPVPASSESSTLQPSPNGGGGVSGVPPKSVVLLPSDTSKVQVKQEDGHVAQVSHAPVIPSVPSINTQLPSQTSQTQTISKSQVVLLVKKEDRCQEERLSRKRPRSASLDVPLQIPTPTHGAMMPPPVKKEVISPLSPLETVSPLAHLPNTISPQSQSQLLQQQTLQAAAAAAAAASASSSSSSSQQHGQSSLQLPPQGPPVQQLQQQQQPSPPLHLPQAVLTTAQSQQQPPNLPSAASQAVTPSSNSSARTITIPSQGAVKLSLSSATSSAGSGIPSGTHKVIIVSSTTPSILQRSLSVPVVKSLSTNAPSQPSSSTLVLNTTHQTQQAASSVCNPSHNAGSIDATPSSSSHQVVSTSLPNKIQGKIVPQATSKARPRANSIVIPVTPNQANVMNSVGVASVQLKSALQGNKQGLMKSGDSTGLKIMPLANMNVNSKLLQKASSSGPMYVVSTTSTANPTVSMVARTVSSGQRVMTFTSSGPKVAVSTSQAGNVLSKPVQTLQLAQSSGTSSGPTSGKPNVIVVQKGSAPFGRGLTISHGGKEVVGKVLLGGKALTPLNQNQTQSQGSLNSSASVTSNSSASSIQTVPSQTCQPSAQPHTPQGPQGLLSATTSTPTRVVTVQKLPSAVVQGSAGAGNVIVLDLSQEQLNNSAVLNEILASSILQSSNVINFNHGAITEAGNSAINSFKGLINFSNEKNDTDSGVLLSEDDNIMVEGFEHSMISYSDSTVGTLESKISADFSIDVPGKMETSQSFIMDGSSCHHGGQSSNGSIAGTAQSATRIPNDICATAMSNANLSFNDFLDDSSLDDIQPISLDAMKMEIAIDTSDDPQTISTVGDTDENV